MRSRQLLNARTPIHPVHATSVRFADDGAALWAFFDCAATDLRATMTRYKDKVWTEGAVEIFLRPSDATWLAEFQLSPIGTRRDLRVEDPGGGAQTYDDTWSCAGFEGWTTLRRSERGDLTGWQALMRIPWDSVSPAPRSDGWTIGAFRWEYSPLEFSGLAMHPDLDAHDAHFLVPLSREDGG
ncbi:hypothetical protein [Streptomyces sp. NPDC048636]|uniref:hypothetical protein n=1 Tax=Streptomyces sp. NPDC048636 TaxID=3155762 RepID=UPI00342775B3